jgi:hypothetical protein
LDAAASNDMPALQSGKARKQQSSKMKMKMKLEYNLNLNRHIWTDITDEMIEI